MSRQEDGTEGSLSLNCLHKGLRIEARSCVTYDAISFLAFVRALAHTLAFSSENLLRLWCSGHSKV